MTSSDAPDLQLRHDGGAAGPAGTVVRLSEPADLICSVPYLLGFHPRDSLVLVALGGRSGLRLGLTVRVDLPPPEHEAGAARSAVRALLRDAPAHAAVIAIGGGRGTGPPGRSAVDAVLDELARVVVDVHAALWAESTTAAARWGCFAACCCTGTLPDPATTETAAAAVAGGHVVRAERAELQRHVAPADAVRIRRREASLVSRHDRAAGPGRDDGAAEVRAGLVVIDAALGAAAAGRLVLDDALAVDLAVALGDPRVRDVAILRSAGPLAPAAEHLWAALAREIPDPEAAEPAALLAVSALLRGDGALANVALDRAERAWPAHRLTGLLRRVADIGMPPGEFRTCLGLGLGDAPETSGGEAEEPRVRRSRGPG